MVSHFSLSSTEPTGNLTRPKPQNLPNSFIRSYINYALGALFAFRVSHAELGLMINESKGPGRIVGFYGTQAVLAGIAGYATYLITDYWMI